MNATLDGSASIAMRRVVKTAREITATETMDLVLLDVLVDTRDPCV